MAASGEIQRRSRYLGEAVPEKFGFACNGSDAASGCFDYLFRDSDDPLAHSSSNLQKRMEVVQEIATKHARQPYPGPAGRHAYGPNGYIYSSPLDIVSTNER